MPGAVWRPVFAGALFKANGRSSWGLDERRSAGVADCEARAARHGLGPIRWPEPWPTNDVLVARAMAYAHQQDVLAPFALAAMRLAFTEGGELGRLEVVQEAGTRVGLVPDELAEGVQRPEVKEAVAEPMLATLVGLRQSVMTTADPQWQDYLKWALLSTLRDVAAVKVGWPYQRPSLERSAPHRDASRRFVQRARWMAEDLAAAASPEGSMVVPGDSRQSATWKKAFAATKANACVTSPPYLNNFDYADATRLELYFWGSVTTWAEMCEDVRAGMLVATTQQTRKTVAHEAEARLEKFPRLAASLVPLLRRLEVERVRRTRGKEYDRVAAPYFVGIATVLSQLFDALEPRARCAWLIGDSAPYGIYLDTPAMISALASDLGYEPLGDDRVRTRGQRWRTNGVRHRVALSERLITFRRP